MPHPLQSRLRIHTNPAGGINVDDVCSPNRRYVQTLHFLWLFFPFYVVTILCSESGYVDE